MTELQQQIAALLKEGLSQREIAKRLSCARTSVQKLERKLGKVSAPEKVPFHKLTLTHQDWIEHPTLPKKERSVEELIDAAKQQYQRNRQYHDARSLLRVKVKMDGPIGVTLLGDPHIDDNGCNWPQLTDDLDNVGRTPGMMLGQIGDVRNNWVGRLAKKYASQHMTCGETRQLIEWFFRNRPWLFMVQGNHDHWNNEGGNVLNYLHRLAEAGGELSDHEARIAITFPNGNEASLKARHTFPGKSMYNQNHGALRSALNGLKYDVYVHGHEHLSAYQWEYFAHGGWGHQNREGIFCHMVKLGAYKEMDEYASEQGFEDKNGTAAMSLIINPYARHPKDKILALPSVEHGCDYLTYLRSRWENGRL